MSIKNFSCLKIGIGIYMLKLEEDLIRLNNFINMVIENVSELNDKNMKPSEEQKDIISKYVEHIKEQCLSITSLN